MLTYLECPIITSHCYVNLDLESRHRAGPLLERALPGRQQDGHRQLHLALGRQERMDQRGTDLTAQTHV